LNIQVILGGLTSTKLQQIFAILST